MVVKGKSCNHRNNIFITIVNKQLLDEIFVICRIIKVEVRVIRRAEGEADNSYRDIVNLIESIYIYIYIYIYNRAKYLKNYCYSLFHLCGGKGWTNNRRVLVTYFGLANQIDVAVLI